MTVQFLSCLHASRELTLPNGVTVNSESIIFETADTRSTFLYVDFAQSDEVLAKRFFRKLMFMKPLARMIGERDAFHPPEDRFFRFFTNPKITVYMPVDDPVEYVKSTFSKIQQIWRVGGYETWDLG